MCHGDSTIQIAGVYAIISPVIYFWDDPPSFPKGHENQEKKTRRTDPKSVNHISKYQYEGISIMVLRMEISISYGYLNIMDIHQNIS